MIEHTQSLGTLDWIFIGSLLIAALFLICDGFGGGPGPT